MKPRERLLCVMSGGLPDDHLPMLEWAAWWDRTWERWKGEGLPADLDWEASQRYFGLDVLYNVGIAPAVPQAPSHGAAVVTTEADYDRLRESLYGDALITEMLRHANILKARHEAGEISVRLWLDGFFWGPRRLLGIEPHLFSFYDCPDLLKRINADFLAFNLRALEALFPVLKPDFVGMAEDMSYNHGPMLSRELFREFLEPYYKKLTGYIRSHGVRTLVDSDGDVTTMVPWLIEAGIEGVYPLERQAGVDVNHLRKTFPEFILLGGYDKMVMTRGEAAMRAEFERLLPAMRSSRFIPSVDHQTPPGVSLAEYRIYISLFKEYCEKAVR